MRQKNYGQFCGLGLASDLLGQRWAMLIVRDLCVRPHRFTELAAALPGIPSNVLTTRLKDLEEAGVVRRRPVDAPRGVVYELTDWGRQAEGPLDALARWGALVQVEPEPDDVVTDNVVATMLRNAHRCGDHRAGRRTTVFQVRAGAAVAHAAVRGRTIEVGAGEHPSPDLEIVTGPSFRRFLAGRLSVDELLASPGTALNGDAGALEAFERLFRMPLLDDVG